MTKIEREKRKERKEKFNDWVSVNSIKYPDMVATTGNGGVHWCITIGKVRLDIWPSTWRCVKSTPVERKEIDGEIHVMSELEKGLNSLEVCDV